MEKKTNTKRMIAVLLVSVIVSLFMSTNIFSITKATTKDIIRGIGKDKSQCEATVSSSCLDGYIYQTKVSDLGEYVQSISLKLNTPIKQKTALRVYQDTYGTGENMKLVSGVLMQKGDTYAKVEIHMATDSLVIRAEKPNAKNTMVSGYYRELDVQSVNTNENYQNPLVYFTSKMVEDFRIGGFEVWKKLILTIAIGMLIFSPFYLSLKENRKIITLVAVFAELYLIALLVSGITKYDGYMSYQGALVFMSILLAILLPILVFFQYWKQMQIHNLYWIVGLILGLVFMVMLPVYVVPDENTHLYSAYDLSNKFLGIGNAPDGGILMREDDAEFPTITKGYDRNSYEDYYGSFWTMAENTELVETNRMPAKTWRLQYLLSAIGITIGRLLGLGTLPVLMLGRLMNLLFFITMIRYAIKTIPICKNVIVMLACLPMTLQQSMSFSYDVYIISVMFVITALALKLAYDKDAPIQPKELVILTLCFMVCVAVKGHAYFPMMALLLMVAYARKEDNRRLSKLMLVIFGIACVTLVLSVLLQDIVFPSVPTYHPGYENYIEWAQSEGYTLSCILKKPSLIFGIIHETIGEYGYFYVQTFVGNRLGWLEICFSQRCEFVFDLCVIFSVIPRKQTTVELPRYARVTLISVALVEIAFVFAGMLLAWTPITTLAIQGVQGRYFIPIMILVMVALKKRKLVLSNKLDSVIWMIQITTICIAYSQIVTRV